MTHKTAGQELLENAYKLKTPDDSVAYYNAFAPTYDSDFAAQLGWNTPKAIAKAYLSQAKDDVPIADIGCGTGYVAMELGLPREKIDGMDISPEMLAVAKQKNLYRKLYEVDLMGSLDKISNAYGAVLSAGTFTHGHLGPEPLRGLLDIARSGGFFIIGVNQTHFEKQNFLSVLNAMVDENKIGALKIERANNYSKTDHDHSNDHTMILQYRKI
jgi:predicted TPR repeat methyltransferase